jgi:molybdopterin adenylyltransferase
MAVPARGKPQAAAPGVQAVSACRCGRRADSPPWPATTEEPVPMDERRLRVGLVSISDRASRGEYDDQGLPALRTWLQSALREPWDAEERLIADDQAGIEACLVGLVDDARCHLVLTTGGTGPTRRDLAPEATVAVASKILPGFGEQMRQVGLAFVPTAILSRQVGAIRETPDHAALIVNLPGQPKAIRETLEGLRDDAGALQVAGIFAAVPYCLDLIGAPYVETHPAVCLAFRPRAARRPPVP